MKNPTLKLVGYDRNRKIEPVRDDTGKVIELKPVEGSERSTVTLAIPDGVTFPAEVPEDAFDQHLAPMLEQLFPPCDLERRILRDGHGMPASLSFEVQPGERSSASLEMVDHEEYVEVEHEYGPNGEIVNSRAVEGTRTAFLRLKVPEGQIIRAQIPHEHLDPVLAMMAPDFYGPSP